MSAATIGCILWGAAFLIGCGGVAVLIGCVDGW